MKQWVHRTCHVNVKASRELCQGNVDEGDLNLSVTDLFGFSVHEFYASDLYLRWGRDYDYYIS